MKKLFTILVLFITLNGVSQNFAPPGATWYYSFYGTWSEGFVRLDYTGDTIIQGIDAQVLTSHITYYFWPSEQTTYDAFSGYNYTYTDGDSVYLLIGDEFKLIYDFTVMPGDTVFTYLTFIYSDSVEYCDSIGRSLVTDIGVDTINGMALRWYTIEEFENSPVNFHGKIFERMGGQIYLFGQPTDCYWIVESAITGLRCYEDDNFEYKPYSIECDYVITGIDKITKNQNLFSFYPNPANKELTIEVDQGIQVKMVSIYSYDGKITIEKPISDNTLQIDISELQPGIYLLEVETDDGFKQVKRLSISNNHF
jgi:hypothetical protein